MLSVSEGGIIVGLNGAHWGAAKPLVDELRRDDAEVHVCTDPRALVSLPVGSRVVLLEYVHELPWLNLHRPVVRDRNLRLFLWGLDQHTNALRTHATDFLDWVSHRVEIPAFSPRFSITRLREALEHHAWVSLLVDPEKADALAATVGATSTGLDYTVLLDSLREASVVLARPRTEEDVWKILIAWMQEGCRASVLLANTSVVPELVPTVDSRPVPWTSAAKDGCSDGSHLLHAAAADLDPEVLGRSLSPPSLPEPRAPPDAVRRALLATSSSERLSAAEGLLDENPRLHEVALAWAPHPDSRTAKVWSRALRLRTRAVVNSRRTRSRRRELLAGHRSPMQLDSAFPPHLASEVAAACSEFGLGLLQVGAPKLAGESLSHAVRLLRVNGDGRSGALFHARFFLAECHRVQGCYAEALDGYRRTCSTPVPKSPWANLLFAQMREAEMLYLLDRWPDAIRVANRVNKAAQSLNQPPADAQYPDLALDAQEKLAARVFSQLGDLYIRLHQQDRAIRSWLQGCGFAPSSVTIAESGENNLGFLHAYFERHKPAPGVTQVAGYPDWRWRAGWAARLRSQRGGRMARVQLATAASLMERSVEWLVGQADAEPERVDWVDLAACSALKAAVWRENDTGSAGERHAYALWSTLDARDVLPPVRRADFEALEARAHRSGD